MSSKLPDVEDSVSYDAETETYRATFDDSRTTPSVAVTEMMATILERDPPDLTPLSAVIDPEALDQFLVRHTGGQRGGDRAVEFTFHGHEVTVLSCGIVKVRPEATEE